MGYDQWDQSSAGLDSAHPGPIDNSNLLKGTCVQLYIDIARPNIITQSHTLLIDRVMIL